MDNWQIRVDERNIKASSIIYHRLAGAAECGDAEESQWVGKLWLGVIQQSVDDLFANNEHSAEAERFLFSKDLDPIARAIGLDAQWVRDTVTAVADYYLSHELAA